MVEPLFRLEEKNLFEEQDPFNDNVVRGHIQRGSGSKYGMLFITHVNGKECPQYVWATPKMGYPFNDKGFIPIPEDAKLEAYEKLDGTNVLAYTYKDDNGNVFVSYKTRLRPFLMAGKFGDFVSLWKEMLVKYSVKECVLKAGCNLSFEMYGSKNKILLDYDVLLDIRLLFGVKPGLILSPMQLCKDVPWLIGKLPQPKLIDISGTGKDFEWQYKTLREYLNKKLDVVKVVVDGEEKIESLSGMEGAVIYVVQQGVIQYKAKPDAVQDIHWADRGIPYHSIYTTIINAFEEADNPSFELIVELLKEEFDEALIYKKAVTIGKMLAEIKFEKKLKAELRDEYIRAGLDIVRDKAVCMRHFSKLHDRKLMQKIFTHLMDEFAPDWRKE